MEDKNRKFRDNILVNDSKLKKTTIDKKNCQIKHIN